MNIYSHYTGLCVFFITFLRCTLYGSHWEDQDVLYFPYSTVMWKCLFKECYENNPNSDNKMDHMSITKTSQTDPTLICSMTRNRLPEQSSCQKSKQQPNPDSTTDHMHDTIKC